MAYHPSNRARDARWRKIKIKLRTPKGFPPLSVYAKIGYYAPARQVGQHPIHLEFQKPLGTSRLSFNGRNILFRAFGIASWDHNKN